MANVNVNVNLGWQQQPRKLLTIDDDDDNTVMFEKCLQLIYVCTIHHHYSLVIYVETTLHLLSPANLRCC